MRVRGDVLWLVLVGAVVTVIARLGTPDTPTTPPTLQDVSPPPPPQAAKPVVQDPSAPFMVDGVALGMTESQIKSVLGPAFESTHGVRWYNHNYVVIEDERAVRVSGGHLTRWGAPLLDATQRYIDCVSVLGTPSRVSDGDYCWVSPVQHIQIRIPQCDPNNRVESITLESIP